MKNKYLKILILFTFFVLSFGIFGEAQEEFDKVTIQELKELKVNQKSILKTMEGLKWQLTEPDKSVQILQEAIKLDNKNYLAYYVIGSIYRTRYNDAKKAIEYYEKAIKANPKNPRPYNNMIIAYAYLGDVKKANEINKNMIDLFPEYPESYYSWALKLMGEKKYSESTEYMKKAIEKYNKIDKLNYWYITKETKQYGIMDAQKVIVYNYLDQNKLTEAIEFFKDDVFINMKQNKYPDVNQLLAVLYEKNQELYEKENPKLYKENFDNLKSIEFLGLMVEAAEFMEKSDKNK